MQLIRVMALGNTSIKNAINKSDGKSTDYSNCRIDKVGTKYCPSGTTCPPGQHSAFNGRWDDHVVICKNNWGTKYDPIGDNIKDANKLISARGSGISAGDNYTGYTSMGYPSGGGV